jgi:F-type H+-transporting ATPase subunit epsilon
MRLSIVTPTRAFVETDADSVVAPGSEGELGILPGHAPLLATLKPGVVRYSEGGRTARVAVGGGLVEVTQERVTVLAPSAESPEQIRDLKGVDARTATELFNQRLTPENRPLQTPPQGGRSCSPPDWQTIC